MVVTDTVCPGFRGVDHRSVGPWNPNGNQGRGKLGQLEGGDEDHLSDGVLATARATICDLASVADVISTA